MSEYDNWLDYRESSEYRRRRLHAIEQRLEARRVRLYESGDISAKLFTDLGAALEKAKDETARGVFCPSADWVEDENHPGHGDDVSDAE